MIGEVGIIISWVSYSGIVVETRDSRSCIYPFCWPGFCSRVGAHLHALIVGIFAHITKHRASRTLHLMMLLFAPNVEVRRIPLRRKV
jgi:hypothetical protein